MSENKIDLEVSKTWLQNPGGKEAEEVFNQLKEIDAKLNPNDPLLEEKEKLAFQQAYYDFQQEIAKDNMQKGFTEAFLPRLRKAITDSLQGRTEETSTT
ncbi:MAG: hypothetical protein ABFQ62_03940 [Patescibacteria group bacterium]